MNVSELLDLLLGCNAKLNACNIDDITKLDLEILIGQIKKQIILDPYTKTKNFDEVVVPDITKLSGLINNVEIVIDEEKERTELIQNIISISQAAFKSIGIRIIL